MENLIPNHIVIYPKDIQNITGRKERTARKMIAALKKKVGKNKLQFSNRRRILKTDGF